MKGRRSIVSFGDPDRCDPDELLEKAEAEAAAMGYKQHHNLPSKRGSLTVKEWIGLIRKANHHPLWGSVEFTETKGKALKTLVVSKTIWGCTIKVNFMNPNMPKSSSFKSCTEILETRDVAKFCLIAGLMYEKA